MLCCDLAVPGLFPALKGKLINWHDVCFCLPRNGILWLLVPPIVIMRISALLQSRVRTVDSKTTVVQHSVRLICISYKYSKPFRSWITEVMKQAQQLREGLIKLTTIFSSPPIPRHSWLINVLERGASFVRGISKTLRFRMIIAGNKLDECMGRFMIF